jgi:hypothetical protein
LKVLKKIWIIFFLIPLFFFWFSTNKFEGWTHLELGAGNYGQDGHTQTALQKTILMKFSYVSNIKNFIEDLEAKGEGDYKAEQQYGVLFTTLDELVKRRGPVGVFHVNDLYPEYVDFAVQKLKIYAQQKGYDSVIIAGIPGDYEKIDAKKYLSKYGRKKYDSIHLKNPEISFFHDQMNGDHLHTSDQVRQSTRTLLQHLANLSENGLYFFTLYEDDFFPLIEQKEFVEKGIFYHLTQEWEPFPYIFPEGDTVPAKWSKVFLIKPETKK